MSRAGTPENLGADDPGRWRLGARARKGVLVVHIASACCPKPQKTSGFSQRPVTYEKRTTEWRSMDRQ